MTLTIDTMPTLQDLMDAPLGTLLRHGTSGRRYLKGETGWVQYDEGSDRAYRSLVATPDIDRYSARLVTLGPDSLSTTVQRFKQQFRTVALGQGVRSSIDRHHVVEVMEGLRMPAPTELRLGMWVDTSDREMISLIPTGALVGFGLDAEHRSHSVCRWVNGDVYSRRWVLGSDHTGNAGVLLAVPEGTALAEWLPPREDEAERLVAFKAAAWTAGLSMKSRAGWCGVYEWTMSRIEIGEHHASLFAEATAAAATDGDPATLAAQTYRVGDAVTSLEMVQALPVGTWLDMQSNGRRIYRKRAADSWTNEEHGANDRHAHSNVGISTTGFHHIVALGAEPAADVQSWTHPDGWVFPVGHRVANREELALLPVGTALDMAGSRGTRLYVKLGQNSWSNETLAPGVHRYTDSQMSATEHEIVAFPAVEPEPTAAVQSWTDGFNTFSVGMGIMNRAQITALPAGTVLDMYDTQRGQSVYRKLGDNSWSHVPGNPDRHRFVDTDMAINGSHHIVSLPTQVAVRDQMPGGERTLALPIGTILMRDHIVYLREENPVTPATGLTRLRTSAGAAGVRASNNNRTGHLHVVHVGNGTLTGFNYEVPSAEFLERMPAGTTITNSVGTTFSRETNGRWATDSGTSVRTADFPIGRTHLQSIPSNTTTSEEDN